MVGHTSSQNETAECLSSVATFTAEFQTASGRNFSTRTVSREIHEMGFHGRAAAHKPNITMSNVKPRLEWCKACRSGNTFSGVMNQASPSGTTDDSGSGECQENATCPKCILPTAKFVRGGIIVQAGSLSSTDRKF